MKIKVFLKSVPYSNTNLEKSILRKIKSICDSEEKKNLFLSLRIFEKNIIFLFQF